MRLARRMENLGTETAFELLAKAKALEAQGKDIIHLEIGEPDFDTPPHIVEAAIKALREGWTHYGPSQGLPDVREVLARHFSRTRGVQARPEQVVVTAGAKPIIFYSILALVQEGDEVIYPDPGFPIYESMVRFCGARPVPMRLLEAKGYHPDLDDLASKVNQRTRMIILNSPQNPTGSILSRQELEAIAEMVQRREDIYVLSDEVYSSILYAGEHYSIASLPGMLERTILLDGFSKAYAMTGWRLGYAHVPQPLVAPVVRLITNSVSCATTFVQKAGVAAIEGPQESVKAMVAEFRKRRDLVVKGLRSIRGINCPEPEGAFYAFPSIRDTGISSHDFQELALKETGVALLSGTSFGRHGEGYIRISYANSQENLKKAMERLESFVSRYSKAMV